jgi:hypothetical protein
VLCVRAALKIELPAAAWTKAAFGSTVTLVNLPLLSRFDDATLRAERALRLPRLNIEGHRFPRSFHPPKAHGRSEPHDVNSAGTTNKTMTATATLRLPPTAGDGDD